MLNGDLSRAPLPDVLRRLAAGLATGRLDVAGPDGSGSVHLRDGAAYHATGPWPRASLAARLLARGALTPADLPSSDVAEQDLAAVLVDAGVVPAEVVDAFRCEQVLHAVGELTVWSSGTWTFTPHARTHADVAPPLGVPTLLAAVAHRRAVWQAVEQVLDGAHDVPVLSAAGADTGGGPLDPEAWALLHRVDGVRTVGELAQACGLTLFEAGRTVHELVQAGLLEVEPAAAEPSYQDDGALVPAGGASVPAGLRARLGAALAAAAPTPVGADVVDLATVRAQAQRVAEERARAAAQAADAAAAALAQAQAQAQAQAEAQAQAQAEEQAEAQAQEQAQEQAQAELDAADAARRQAQEAAERVAAELAARRTADEQARQAEAHAAAQVRAEAEAAERARAEAEARARLEAEAERARAEAEADERARAEAEARARLEAEARVRAEAEARARLEAEQLAAEQARLVAAHTARQAARHAAEARRQAEQRDAAEQARHLSAELAALEDLPAQTTRVDPDSAAAAFAELRATASSSPSGPSTAPPGAGTPPAVETDSAAAAFAELRATASSSPSGPSTAPPGAGTPPAVEAPPVAQTAKPVPTWQQGWAVPAAPAADTDTASLLRELASLGDDAAAGDGGTPHAPATGTPAPRVPGAQQAAVSTRKRKGIFGR